MKMRNSYPLHLSGMQSTRLHDYPFTQTKKETAVLEAVSNVIPYLALWTQSISNANYPGCRTKGIFKSDFSTGLSKMSFSFMYWSSAIVWVNSTFPKAANLPCAVEAGSEASVSHTTPQIHLADVPQSAAFVRKCASLWNGCIEWFNDHGQWRHLTSFLEKATEMGQCTEFTNPAKLSGASPVGGDCGCNPN